MMGSGFREALTSNIASIISPSLSSLPSHMAPRTRRVSFAPHRFPVPLSQRPPRSEDNLQYQENLANLMRSVEYGILSNNAPAAASILHEVSGKLDNADPDTWAWVKVYDKAKAALDKLNTENAATKAAEDREK
jgi:hypothetical protein